VTTDCEHAERVYMELGIEYCPTCDAIRRYVATGPDAVDASMVGWRPRRHREGTITLTRDKGATPVEVVDREELFQRAVVRAQSKEVTIDAWRTVRPRI